MNAYVQFERVLDSRGNVISSDVAPGLTLRAAYDTQLDVRLLPASELRVREDGELFRLRKARAVLYSSPGRVLSYISAQLELGDQVDVEGSRLGTGGSVNLSGRIRPHDRIEIELSYSTDWVNGASGVEDGKRLYTEHALQVNAIYHFSPRDTVRAIVQRTRTTRDPSLYALPVAARSSGSTVSFVYGHAARLGTAAYVGLTLTDGETPGFSARRREDEVFVKLSWQI